ncbi:DMT family transporter [Pallidibacillus thermolactis]|jgi:drug/metabolite transporter (DMT)-like permease|uniref:DMT family transporter n=1 Tax=Pallidibacillus thermolactis TaxID=251051 RepID=UPI0021D83BC5|nr:DMT family transporter [Pallidibacillus thermolactis]MCU9600820.1 DMT family transporter [Pallidibacillus thermolactis subsp. kokeshiiformis]
MKKVIVNPLFLIFIGVISVSTSAIFVKLSSAPAGVLAFYRLFFSVVILAPLFLIKYVNEIKNMTKKDIILSIIAGVFLAFHFILWFESLNYTSVASSTVLVTMQPLFSFIGTYLFFKEPLSVRSMVSAIITISGCIIISWGDFYIDESAILGDLLALIACGLITSYLLIGQSIRQRISLVTYTFVVYFMSSITLFLYVLIKGETLYPYPVEDWTYFLLLAIIATLLGHSLFNLAIKWVSTNVISMAILFEPVGAAILAFFILGESLVWTQLLGGIIVIIGLAIFSFNTVNTKKI